MRGPAVLHLIGQFTLGGAEKQLARLASLQAERGGRVKICVFAGELSPALLERAAPCPVERLPLGARRGGRLRALTELVRREGWELLAGQLFSGNLYAVAAARRCGVPALVFEGGLETWARPWHWALSRWYWRRAELIEVNARAVGENVIAHGGPARKIRLIYNGVEETAVLGAAERQAARSSLGLGDEPLVLMTANLHPPKDPFTLLRAVAPLVTSRGPVRLWLAGDGPLRGDVERLVAELDLGERVRLLGRVDDVRPLLAAADVTCLSSGAEGLSNSIIESLAAGVPCAAGDAGGNAELLGDDERGLLFAPGDVEGCREALRRLLEEEETAGELARKGRDWVMSELDFERNLELHHRLYDEALERWGSRRRRG